MFPSIPIILIANVLADHEDLEAIFVHPNNTNGPTKEWVSKVATKIRSFAIQLSRSKSGRKALVKKPDPELQKMIDTFRDKVGPKSNISDEGNSEADPTLLNFALEGDMILNPDQLDELMQQAPPTSRKRAVTTNPAILWTVGQPIPYEIDYSLASIANKIRAGIRFWSDNSCLNFVESPTASNRLRYYYGTGCFSFVGRQSSWGSQDISLGPGCDSYGTICHETAHAMGFFHTQSRYDRDYFLNVYYSNIQPSLSYNFVVQSAATETHFGLPYDYGSVMQYDPYAFAIDPDYPTSFSKDLNYHNAMGQREGPSFMDIVEMNLLYRCADYCPSQPTCYNYGIVNPKTCRTCICPRYYGGPYCQSLKQGTAPVCNGNATSSTFVQLNATAGLGWTNQYYSTGIPYDCYWIIQAPQGRRLQLQVTYVSTTCMEGCNWGGFELNIGYVQQYGMVFCCPSFRSQSFTTIEETALIRGFSRYNNVNMLLNYRVI